VKSRKAHAKRALGAEGPGFRDQEKRRPGLSPGRGESGPLHRCAQAATSAPVAIDAQAASRYN